MIKEIKTLPDFEVSSAEAFKIRSNFENYPDLARFFVQDEKTFISLLDNNMAVLFGGTDKTELSAFIGTVRPKTVFSRYSDLKDIFHKGEKAGVLIRTAPENCDISSDTLKSDEIYSILNADGLNLPPYEYFAVDFCRRLNHGTLNYFALRDICAAITLKHNDTLLLNGIASHKKGYGSLCLKGVLAKSRYKKVFAVAREELFPFYLKNGFTFSYNVCYWRL